MSRHVVRVNNSRPPVSGKTLLTTREWWLLWTVGLLARRMGWRVVFMVDGIVLFFTEKSFAKRSEEFGAGRKR